MLNDETATRATRSWRSNQNHGRELMPAIMSALAEMSLAPKDVTHVTVALGPGGFSAVRVGISAALGLAIANQLPVLGVPTHDLEVEPYLSEISKSTAIYSLIPAGRNEVSWMRHAADIEPTIGIASPEQFVEDFDAGSLLCGEACDLIAGLVDQTQFRGQAPPTRDPGSLLDIAHRKFSAGHSTPYEELRPIYARLPSISKPKPAK